MVIERRFPRRVEELWAYWTTKDGFEAWWGPEKYRVRVFTLEPRLDGLIHTEIYTDDPEQIAVLKAMGRPNSHETRARFSEFLPTGPAPRLAITNRIDFLPNVSPYDNSIRMELHPASAHPAATHPAGAYSAGAMTLMRIALEPMHDEEMTRLSFIGFESALRKLEKLTR